MFLDEHFAKKTFLKRYCIYRTYLDAAHAEDTFLRIDLWGKIIFFKRKSFTGTEIHTCFALHTFFGFEIGNGPEEAFDKAFQWY